jgi:hypothetical protein
MALNKEYIHSNGSFNSGEKLTLVKSLESVDSSANLAAAVAAGPSTSLTDNSGGTASDTIAAISDTATKNAVASLAAKVNALIAAIQAL